MEESLEYTKRNAIPALGHYPKEPISMGVSFLFL